MRLLELFCGTGSIGRAFERRGFEVISVDIAPKAKATHTCDIMNFDYRQYPPGYFDVVWGSPPCTMYSRARTTGGPRDLDGADRLVAKTIEIMAYFEPVCWAFENVGSGLLPKRQIVEGIHCSYLTYCKYADADFPKTGSSPPSGTTSTGLPGPSVARQARAPIWSAANTPSPPSEPPPRQEASEDPLLATSAVSTPSTACQDLSVTTWLKYVGRRVRTQETMR